MDSRGAYILLIEGTDTTDEPMGVWALSSPNDAEDGHVQRITHVRGSAGERINVHWPGANSPKLYYTTAPAGGGTSEFNVKIIGV